MLACLVSAGGADAVVAVDGGGWDERCAVSVGAIQGVLCGEFEFEEGVWVDKEGGEMRGAEGDGYSTSAAPELGFGREGEGSLERFFMDCVPREGDLKLEIYELRMECANW